MIEMKLYSSWQAFVQYLKEQVFDLKQIQDHSSPIYSQVGLFDDVRVHLKCIV